MHAEVGPHDRLADRLGLVVVGQQRVLVSLGGILAAISLRARGPRRRGRRNRRGSPCRRGSRCGSSAVPPARAGAERAPRGRRWCSSRGRREGPRGEQRPRSARGPRRRGWPCGGVATPNVRADARGVPRPGPASPVEPARAARRRLPPSGSKRLRSHQVLAGPRRVRSVPSPKRPTCPSLGSPARAPPSRRRSSVPATRGSPGQPG